MIETAAPDATAGDGLRSAIARGFAPNTWDILLPRHRDRLYAQADRVLALPALRDVLAAAARDAEKVRVVRELLPRIEGVIEFDMAGERYDAVMSVQQVRDHLIAALDGNN